ncbi:MAG: glycyl-radical enzyme activating protein, partial [Armatimonadetes bacterium]|nr:glycyl-radical enzyme activating protein [Armatimonadota bacterium]
ELLTIALAAHAAPLDPIPLWPDKAPGALGDADHDKPTITPFLPAPEKATGAAIVICPGGGYGGLAPHEGHDYALWLNQHGVSAFVLKYRLGSAGYRHPRMLEDAARNLAASSDRANRSVLARVFDIQRFSIHDGPGIRTTVFFKGCPLRCVWCHNPESQDEDPQLSFTPGQCLLCRACYAVCPAGAHRDDDEGEHIIHRDECALCGACVKECYPGALEMIGREASVGEILDEVLRDRAFYESSGGGLTLSGGEPLSQPEAAAALLAAAHEAGLHTAVETCGYAEYPVFARVAPHVDLFLYDLKETNDTRHRWYTGVGLDLILDNLNQLHDSGATILLRLPLIPGLNGRRRHFEEVARIVAGLPNLVGVEALGYHPLGLAKLERLGLPPGQEIPALPPETFATWIAELRELGLPLINEA